MRLPIPLLLAMPVLALPVLAGPMLAGCPAAPDRSAEMQALLAEARAATTEMAGRVVTGRMWEIWTTAPDAPAQELLDRGIAAMRIGDALDALDAFDRLVVYCPGYAEGWNQRAFVHFLAGRMEAARQDLDRALDIDPRHVAALTGLALTLTALGEEAAAQRRLREALALHPWLPERVLLKDPAARDL